jgi:hypothetical protein
MKQWLAVWMVAMICGLAGVRAQELPSLAGPLRSVGEALGRSAERLSVERGAQPLDVIWAVAASRLMPDEEAAFIEGMRGGVASRLWESLFLEMTKGPAAGLAMWESGAPPATDWEKWHAARMAFRADKAQLAAKWTEGLSAPVGERFTRSLFQPLVVAQEWERLRQFLDFLETRGVATESSRGDLAFQQGTVEAYLTDLQLRKPAAYPAEFMRLKDWQTVQTWMDAEVRAGRAQKLFNHPPPGGWTLASMPNSLREAMLPANLPSTMTSRDLAESMIAAARMGAGVTLFAGWAQTDPQRFVAALEQAEQSGWIIDPGEKVLLALRKAGMDTPRLRILEILGHAAEDTVKSHYPGCRLPDRTGGARYGGPRGPAEDLIAALRSVPADMPGTCRPAWSARATEVKPMIIQLVEEVAGMVSPTVLGKILGECAGFRDLSPAGRAWCLGLAGHRQAFLEILAEIHPDDPYLDRFSEWLWDWSANSLPFAFAEVVAEPDARLWKIYPLVIAGEPNRSVEKVADRLTTARQMLDRRPTGEVPRDELLREWFDAIIPVLRAKGMPADEIANRLRGDVPGYALPVSEPPSLETKVKAQPEIPADAGFFAALLATAAPPGLAGPWNVPHGVRETEVNGSPFVPRNTREMLGGLSTDTADDAFAHAVSASLRARVTLTRSLVTNSWNKTKGRGWVETLVGRDQNRMRADLFGLHFLPPVAEGRDFMPWVDGVVRLRQGRFRLWAAQTLASSDVPFDAIPADAAPGELAANIPYVAAADWLEHFPVAKKNAIATHLRDSLTRHLPKAGSLMPDAGSYQERASLEPMTMDERFQLIRVGSLFARTFPHEAVAASWQKLVASTNIEHWVREKQEILNKQPAASLRFARLLHDCNSEKFPAVDVADLAPLDSADGVARSALLARLAATRDTNGMLAFLEELAARSSPDFLVFLQREELLRTFPGNDIRRLYPMVKRCAAEWQLPEFLFLHWLPWLATADDATRREFFETLVAAHPVITNHVRIMALDEAFFRSMRSCMDDAAAARTTVAILGDPGRSPMLLGPRIRQYEWMAAHEAGIPWQQLSAAMPALANATISNIGEIAYLSLLTRPEPAVAEDVERAYQRIFGTEAASRLEGLASSLGQHHGMRNPLQRVQDKQGSTQKQQTKEQEQNDLIRKAAAAAESGDRAGFDTICANLRQQRVPLAILMLRYGTDAQWQDILRNEKLLESPSPENTVPWTRLVMALAADAYLRHSDAMDRRLTGVMKTLDAHCAREPDRGFTTSESRGDLLVLDYSNRTALYRLAVSGGLENLRRWLLQGTGGEPRPGAQLALRYGELARPNASADASFRAYRNCEGNGFRVEWNIDGLDVTQESNFYAFRRDTRFYTCGEIPKPIAGTLRFFAGNQTGTLEQTGPVIATAGRTGAVELNLPASTKAVQAIFDRGNGVITTHSVRIFPGVADSITPEKPARGSLMEQPAGGPFGGSAWTWSQPAGEWIIASGEVDPETGIIYSFWRKNDQSALSAATIHLQVLDEQGRPIEGVSNFPQALYWEASLPGWEWVSLEYPKPKQGARRWRLVATAMDRQRIISQPLWDNAAADLTIAELRVCRAVPPNQVLPPTLRRIGKSPEAPIRADFLPGRALVLLGYQSRNDGMRLETWDAAGNEPPVRDVLPLNIHHITPTPAGAILATDGELWRYQPWKPVGQRLACLMVGRREGELRFAPDGQIFYRLRDKRLEIFDARGDGTARLVHAVDGTDDRPPKCWFAADSTEFAVLSGDQVTVARRTRDGGWSAADPVPSAHAIVTNKPFAALEWADQPTPQASQASHSTPIGLPDWLQKSAALPCWPLGPDHGWLIRDQAGNLYLFRE